MSKEGRNNQIRQMAEYGGFLPLELNHNKEYFSRYEPNVRRFNSVKAALDYFIRESGIKKIWIPYYYCPSTIDAIKKTGIQILYYHIDESFLPIDYLDKEDSAILFVDFFGICSRQVRKTVTKIKNAEIIVDWAHGFFEKPIYGGNVQNIYSAKKFFGVPDGAYLVGETITSDDGSASKSHEFADYLLKSFEIGTNAAYSRKKEADKIIAEHYDSMSLLSLGLLKNVDYNRVKKKRQSNYTTLYEVLMDINEMQLPPKAAAYQFPLLIRDIGRKIKCQLIEDRIFVSTLWSGDELLAHGNDFELSMMNDCIFLPVDQRYNDSDMRFLASHIRELLYDNT